MQFWDYLSEYTGLSIDRLRDGNVVSVCCDADGNFSFPVWAVSGRSAPTSEQITAALAAGPSHRDLVTYAAYKRWQIETGGVKLNGMQIDTSRESQSLITGAWASAQLNPDFMARWKAADGSWLMLAAPQIAAIAAAVSAHVQSCFAAEADIDAQIEAGEIKTIEDIDAFPWPGNV